MSDLPNLPSDEDLGLTKEEIEELEKEFDDDGPEMSAAEMAALFGEAPPPPEPPAPKAAPKAAAKGPPAGASRPAPSPEAAAPASESGSDPKAEKAAAKAAAKQAKEEAKKAKAEAKRAAKEAREEAPKEEAPRPVLEESPRTKWRGPATLVLLILFALFSSTRTGQVRPVPANAPEGDFSSARAMTMLVDIAREAHPPGSPNHAVVRQFIVDRLTAMGLEPEVQTASSMIQRPGMARTATVRNIVARIPGTASTGAVLATAHYDGREIALGAGDDGSGVVSLLEALRAIQTGPPLQNDLILLFTDAEELGLLGARAFVNEHPMMADVRIALSFEMRGGGGPVTMFETNAENGWVVRALQAGAPHAVANSMSYEIYRRMPNDTDFTPFREAGIQGLNFAGIDNAHVYHQEYDSPENLSESTLQHQGLNALTTMLYLGNQDLGTVDGPNAVYLNVPVLGLVVYDARLVMPISAGLIVLFLFGLVLARGGGWGFSGTVVGAVVSLVGGALSIGAAIGITGWLEGRHPELDSLHGSAYHSEGWYVLALAAVAFTIVTALHGIARKRYRWQELTLGAVVVPLAAAVAVGLVAPLAAMNLQIPVAAALLALVSGLVLAKNADGVIGWAIAVVFSFVVLNLFVPITELLWLAMSIRLGAGIVGLIVVALYLCLPALDSLRHPNAWWAPVTGLVVAGSTLGLGILAARPSADRPAPSTLVYAYEHGAPQGLWATSPVTDSAVDLSARGWAEGLTGVAFADREDLSGFGYVRGDIPVSAAGLVDAAPPLITYETDEIVDSTRRVTLTVVSQIGAEMIRFAYPEGGRTLLTSLNGDEISDPEALNWADHWGTPDPAIVLTLEMPADAEVELDVVEHLLRPEELLGEGAFARPKTLAPNVNRLSDRAMFKSAVRPAGASGDFSPMPPDLSAPGAAETDAVPDTTMVPDTTIVPDTAAMPDTTAVPDTTAFPTDTIGR